MDQDSTEIDMDENGVPVSQAYASYWICGLLINTVCLHEGEPLSAAQREAVNNVLGHFFQGHFGDPVLWAREHIESYPMLQDDGAAHAYH